LTADARIVSLNNLALKEAALTGESTQVEKGVEPLAKDTRVAERKNTVCLHLPFHQSQIPLCRDEAALKALYLQFAA
jgi:magnesium-transporting ATPase (P-type)